MDVVWFWVLVLLPPLGFALWIHALEHFIQARMARAFGWRSVLVTGWLGTPVHELSHAATCLLFRHRIDEIQLFDPDVKEGRLGYVRHSWRKGNWFEEIGNVFIGTAPLVGGAAVLTGLMALFYPQLVGDVFRSVREVEGSGVVLLRELPAIVLETLGRLFQPANLATPRFWLFAWLVTCIGSHMAPSRSDYAGAGRGLWLAALVLIAISLLAFGVFRLESRQVLQQLAALMAPVFVVGVLAAALVSASAVLVWLLTAAWLSRRPG